MIIYIRDIELLKDKYPHVYLGLLLRELEGRVDTRDLYYHSKVTKFVNSHNNNDIILGISLLELYLFKTFNVEVKEYSERPRTKYIDLTLEKKI